MTPKGKAEDLILKYSILKNGHNHLVKQCALMVVDEIISEFKVMVPDPYKQQYKYWEQVKQEIEKL